MTNYVKVKNLVGTSDNLPPSGYYTWKHYWIIKSNKSWPSQCASYGCNETADVAGHVKLVDGSNKWYLVPICYAHNNTNEPYYVRDDLLVKIN